MKIELLDHGYVEFIEAWGGGRTQYFDGDHREYEAGIIEAARQSTQGAFRGWEGAPCDCGLGAPRKDEFGNPTVYIGKHPDTCASVKNPGDAKLLRYLFTNKPPHGTPFEFSGMVLEVQAPIMVFREWHRHRTQSYNEMSARYAPLPDLYYHCHVDEVIARAHKAATQKNKQAAGVAPVDEARIMTWVSADLSITKLLEAHYQEGLAAGVPKELARKKMPVDHYSRMRAAANLRNWLAFMTLRQHKDVMHETRLYAEAVGELSKGAFPRTYALFEELKTAT